MTFGFVNCRPRGAAALDHRPAVVAALADEVDLVDLVLAELGGPQATAAIPGEALDVAVAERPHRRARERVVGGDAPIGVDAQDLAVGRAAVLGQAGVPGLADPGVELAVGTEGDAAAVVDRRGAQAGEDRRDGAVAELERRRCGCRAPWSGTRRRCGRARRRGRRRGRAARPRRRPARPGTVMTARGGRPWPGSGRSGRCRARRRGRRRRAGRRCPTACRGCARRCAAGCGRHGRAPGPRRLSERSRRCRRR